MEQPFGVEWVYSKTGSVKPVETHPVVLYA